MKIKKTINRIVIFSLIVICVSLFFRSCQQKHEYSTAVEDLLREKFKYLRKLETLEKKGVELGFSTQTDYFNYLVKKASEK